MTNIDVLAAEDARRVREHRPPLTAAERQREARYARAVAICIDRLPDLVDDRGQPCPWAVWALLDLWRSRGEGNVTPAAIRAERRRRLDHTKARWGTDPTEPQQEEAA